MSTKNNTNWWIDATLFVGFLVAFFLDLTGVELHQWIGTLGGLLALYHLLDHWEWVSAVSQRFFGRTSGKARLNYMVDAGLFAGFILMVGTGLVISTWFDFTLSSYKAWLTLHILTSISTLLVLLVKLGLHWRWIVRSLRSALAQPANAPSRTAAAQPVRAAVSAQMSRREFLRMMGLVGAASFLALTRATEGLASLAGSEANSDALEDTTSSLQTTSTDTAQTTTTDSSQLTWDDSSSSSSCMVRCEHACSFPGHCRRYVDSNNNNRCDLGECL